MELPIRCPRCNELFLDTFPGVEEIYSGQVLLVNCSECGADFDLEIRETRIRKARRRKREG